MNKIAIALHGGAGPDSEFIREHAKAYEEGLQNALKQGYVLLSKGASALDAVEATVKSLEDNLLFNAGRGSALNHKGEVEMDASIMDGKKKKAGAVSIVRNVKNPIALARFIMNRTNHILISGQSALELAKDANIHLEADSYFITDHQVDEFLKTRDQESMNDVLRKRIHGTVGAVALDKKGNLASATSTGGTCNCLSGRIGDSSLIGAGTYASNQVCAVSGTGDGEFLISGVIAHSVAMVHELTSRSLQEACDFVIHERNKTVKGDLGVISVNAKGEIGIAFNSERMHRAWTRPDGTFEVKIYK